MLQRRAFEIFNLALVCVIGYYLSKIQAEYYPIQLTMYSFNGICFFSATMIFIFLTMHQIMIWLYNRMKNYQKIKELKMRQQNVVLDELLRQTRAGNINDPYTQALQQIVITDVKTPKANRKPIKISCDTVDSAGTDRLQDKPSKNPFKKLWRKKEPPVGEVFLGNNNTSNSISNNKDNSKSYSNNTIPKKLKSPPLPPPPVAIHTPKSKWKLRSNSKVNNDITSNPLGWSVQMRIAELTTPK